ncbi:MAG: enoyl-CoA hydratase/isomerase family protein [Gammaproteobacteria bacterium]|nr:enoyl-CoA hydratase/isomerase family protein [Gammaproteobacteria bacterium]
MGEFSTIERCDGWAEIVINRPERRNSLIPPLAGEITEAIHTLQDEDEIASIILRGEGGYFCSGIDLKALQQDPPPVWAGKEVGDVRSMHIALFSCKKPIIGAFEKFGINAGAALAFACDILIAGETAFLQIGEIQQGANIPMNAAWMKIKSTEIVLSRLALYGDRVPGPELVKLGLATECVADDEVVNRCREIAERIASFPRGASANIIESIRGLRNIDDPDAFFPKRSSNALLTAAQVKG